MEKLVTESPSTAAAEEVNRAASRAEAIHEKRLRSLKRARKFLRLKIKAEREQVAAKCTVSIRRDQAIIAHIATASGIVIKVEGMTIEELVQLTDRLSSPDGHPDL